MSDHPLCPPLGPFGSRTSLGTLWRGARRLAAGPPAAPGPVAPGRLSGVTLALLAIWGASSLVLCSFLLSRHLLPLPHPAAGNRQLRAALRSDTDGGRWAAVHILSTGCGCSRRVIESLLGRGPLFGVRERVVLVGAGSDGAEATLRARGFVTEALTPPALGLRYGVEAVPLLLVGDPAGDVRYVGGYTARKSGPVLRDVEIVSALRAGRGVSALPTFGCAVAERLRAALDPLRLSSAPIN